MWEGVYALFDNNPKLFLSRSVSHICAPGFFFTMGMSMTLFTMNRRGKHQWEWKQIFYHYLVRGAVLLLVEYLVDLSGSLPQLVDWMHNRPVLDWRSGKELSVGEILLHSSLGIYEVMTALGLTTIVAPLALPLFFRAQQQQHASSNWIVLLLGWVLALLVFLTSTLLLVAYQDLDNPENEKFPHANAATSNLWEFGLRYLMFPGKLFKQWQMAAYPLFPWLGLTLLGQGFGFEVSKHGTIRYMRVLAVIMFTVFVLIRAFGHELNLRGVGRGEDVGEDSALMAFFLQTKYPPDLCYATITLAVNFLLLELFSTSMIEYVSHPLLVFGRTPLFFYALHFWVIAVAESMFRLPEPPSGKFNLEYVLFVWMGVLVVMYFACKRYYQFKSKTHPTSLWRIF